MSELLKRAALAAMVLVSGLACQPVLTLTVRNPKGEPPYELRFNVKQEGKEPDLQGIGQIGSDSEKVVKESFPKDSRVQVQARRDSYVVWESTEYFMNKNRSDQVTIDSHRVKTVNADESVKALEAAEKRLKQVVATSGYQPIGNVLHTNFGGFVARKKGGPWFTVAGPKLYPDGQKSLEWVKNAVGSAAVKINFSVLMNTKATAQASGGVAIFAAKAGFTDAEFYEYGMNIDVITLTHDDTFASAKAKLSMNKDPVAKQVNAQLDKYIADPKYEVAFIRGMHVFNQYQITYRKGTRINLDTKVNVGTFLDAGAAFALDNTTDNNQLYKDFVGGFLYDSDDDVVDTRPADASSVSSSLSSFKEGGGIFAALLAKIQKTLDPAVITQMLEKFPALRNKMMVVDGSVFFVKESAKPKNDPELSAALLNQKEPAKP